MMFRQTIFVAFRTALWLLRIMIPVSLAVTLLEHFGILGMLAVRLDPVFRLLGLSGQSAFVFITGALLSNYSAIAVMTSLPLTMREVTILALMTLISHNLVTETIILKKTGSNPWVMLSIRLLSSLAGALVLNAMLPEDNRLITGGSSLVPGHPDFMAMMETWAVNSLILSLKVIGLLTGLMLLQRLMEEYGILPLLSRALTPFLRLMGLPAEGAFLWIVANVIGLGFGAGIMKDQYERGKISREHNNIVNHHIAVSHSLLEDTLLYMAIGVGAFWITVPRLLIAVIIVWGYRIISGQLRI